MDAKNAQLVEPRANEDPREMKIETAGEQLCQNEASLSMDVIKVVVDKDVLSNTALLCDREQCKGNGRQRSTS